MSDDLESVTPKDRRAWRAWLRANHTRAGGVWVVYAKRASGLKSVTYDEAVEEALCFGWIDSKVQTIDETFYRQMFTPRKPKSPWSQSNKERVRRMTAAGAMTKAGLAAVEAAQAAGTWAAADRVGRLSVPRDLAAALAAAKARKTFDGFTASVRRGILFWIEEAKRPETRARRIETTARMAAKNLRARVDTE